MLDLLSSRSFSLCSVLAVGLDALGHVHDQEARAAAAESNRHPMAEANFDVGAIVAVVAEAPSLSFGDGARSHGFFTI